ncbi:MAG: double zinc ribbon domain-containing protein [Pyrinomonadaceae bacterium]
MFKTVRDSLLSVVYPQECRICRNSVEKFPDGCACGDCWEKVRVLGRGETTCTKCGAYLAESGRSIVAECRQCVDHAYDKAVAAGVYEHALVAVTVNLKIKPYLPERCKNILIEAVKRLDVSDDTLVIPVPLSEKRLLERGHNQAETIARNLVSRTGMSILTDVLSRKIHTPMHRVAMDDKARQLTVNKAFEVIDNTRLLNAHVLLVDDVFTSGATVSGCAKVLKKNGASRVDVFTLARAVFRIE